MPNQVCVICGEYKRSRKVSFFSIPKQDTRLKNKSDRELVERRIAAWMAAIGSNINKYYDTPSVCSLHFHSGKPAYMFYVDDVDWVPSKNLTNTDQHDEQDHDFDSDLSHAHPSCEDSLRVDDSTVHEIIVNSSSLSDNSTLHDNVLHGTFQSNDITMDDTSLDSNFEHNDTSTAKCLFEIQNLVNFLKKKGITNPEEQTLREIKTHFETFHSTIQTESDKVLHSQTQVSPKVINLGRNSVDEQLQAMMVESTNLKETIFSLRELVKKEKLINRLTDNDRMTKFYTGLKSWKLFEIIYQLILPGIHDSSSFTKRSLPTKEQFLLVLMRLRLNLCEQDLAYRFHISQKSVSSYLVKWIDVMYIRLSRNFMIWPTKEALLKSTPTFFKKKKTFRILRDRVPVPLISRDEDNISHFDKIAFVCCCLSNANPSVVPIR